ncbi:carbonic anhydrase family protein [Variovorax ureilyticus]|uniref:Carbonic anhydrase n=1 Tax=Variovorax ureilyticus TaxID=1836198 RepID=A0ABU8V7V7_9BURK
MARFHHPSLVAGLLVSALTLGASAAEHAHWSYRSGTGPAQWAALDPDNQLCKSGLQQSPIALKTRESKRLNEHDISIHYGLAKGQWVNNGHTIQFNVDGPASNTVAYKAGSYALAQLHFHTPSEHHLNGKSFPMEMHLVNKDASGKITVVGVFIRQGAKNAALAGLWEHLPAPDAAPKTGEVDLASLLPASRKAMVYGGSLTTPPCSEEVNWIVMEQPIEMSRQQIQAFQKLFRDNHRPVQRGHGRKVVEEAAM